jgi:phage FluMu protein gp41
MTLKFELIHGLALGEKLHKHVELRAPTAGDVIDAQEEAEKLVYAMQDGNLAPQLVTSPSLAGTHVLRRQIVKLGEIQGPLDLDVLRKLHLEDFELIQVKVAELDQALAARRAASEVNTRGRDDGGGGGP